MNNMLVALQITALGMGLVFAAIVLLWWMMNLLTRITADRTALTSTSTRVLDSVEASLAIENDRKQQAAAVAVAIALAEQQVSSAHPLAGPPTTIVSAWQLGMRTRQMYQKGGSIKHRAG